MYYSIVLLPAPVISLIMLSLIIRKASWRWTFYIIFLLEALHTYDTLQKDLED
ncbi:hypothetical protein BDV24DRAFT_128125 [Aspergillus arachidicola]|uniref:Uncharacterized protein n=1 Tax=Aspergillus arachidicola TaxID=656916 RepID=A0A5N6YEZ6_9EURO|nr:hypothetical protein BDV24DRAFT_128125 [Aspergillus arachidicola]